VARFQRVRSTPEKVDDWRRKYDQRFCSGCTGSGKRRHGIIHKVFAARGYDGVRCLVAWDSLAGGNPVFDYHDVLDIDPV
jgi:hypothetical protein